MQHSVRCQAKPLLQLYVARFLSNHEPLLSCHRVPDWAPSVRQQLPTTLAICNMVVYMSMLLSQLIPPLSTSPFSMSYLCFCPANIRFISMIFSRFYMCILPLLLIGKDFLAHIHSINRLLWDWNFYLPPLNLPPHSFLIALEVVPLIYSTTKTLRAGIMSVKYTKMLSSPPHLLSVVFPLGVCVPQNPCLSGNSECDLI